MSVLTLDNVCYRYSGAEKYALTDVCAEFEKGKIYAVVGMSGAGKSTLLSLIAGLDVATKGVVAYNGKNLKEIDRDDYRGKEIGVVFQSYNLIKNATATDNLLLSMNISGVKEANTKAKAERLLEQVGIPISDRKRKVLKLSGGEQQRVAIARALSHNPEIIIADEPTGNLDGVNQQKIVDIMRSLAHEENRCVIIVTHSKAVASFADITYKISKGRLFKDKEEEKL